MQRAERTLGRAEFVLICLFAVALPLFEAPKNVFWVLFFFVWIAFSVKSRNWGSLSPGWDAMFGALIAAPLISVLGSAPYPPGWREMGDVLGYVSLGWMLARSRLTTRQLAILIGCLIGATLIAAAHGYWIYLHNVKRIYLQLNSVGHVNHSALYGMGIASMSVVLAAATWFALKPRDIAARVVTVLAALIMLRVMIFFGSRGALIAYAVSVAAFLSVFGRIHKIRIWPMIVLGVLLGGGLLMLDKTLIQKTQINLQNGSVTSARAEAANTAMEMWRHFPLTGVGASNFSAISPAQVEAWVEERGEPYVAQKYLYSSHAHNLFFNTLAERGLVGAAVLICFCVAWLVALVRRRPNMGDSWGHWLSWGTGWSGWCIVFVGGIFNTTLHHEHGMLSMLCLALLLNNQREARA